MCVLRNDLIVAVIAEPLAERNANMTVRQVGGAVIDLTVRNASNEQRSAFYSGGRGRTFEIAENEQKAAHRRNA